MAIFQWEPPNAGIECRRASRQMSGFAIGNCCSVVSLCHLAAGILLTAVSDDQAPCAVHSHGSPWQCTARDRPARSRAVHSHSRPWIVCMTSRLDFTPKTTEWHPIERTGKSEVKVTNNKLRLGYCTVAANYWLTRIIARPLCDSRATC